MICSRTMAEPSTVTHDQKARRFYVQLEGFEACLMYRQQGRTIDLYHTYVPEAFRGHQIAEQLCRAAFEHAKTQGLRVLPSCSYISEAYLKRHPEYQSLTTSGPTSTPLVSG